VPDGRKRAGIHRRGWLHRRHHRRSPAQPIETAPPCDNAGTRPDSGDDLVDTADDSDPAASLDQVLRRAAEARDAEGDPDD
jgi:hypothetical protein